MSSGFDLHALMGRRAIDQSQGGSVGSADRLNGEGEIPRFGRGWASLSENPDPVIAMARRPALEP